MTHRPDGLNDTFTHDVKVLGKLYGDASGLSNIPTPSESDPVWLAAKATYDTHIASEAIHFTSDALWSAIDLNTAKTSYTDATLVSATEASLALVTSDVAANTASCALIDPHIANTNNPHQIDETDILPSQTGNSGKYLTTDGSSSSWAAVPNPSQMYVFNLAGLEFNPSYFGYGEFFDTESQAQMRFPAGTFKRLRVNYFDEGDTQSAFSVTLRDDGVNTSLATTAAASLGVYTDDVNEVSIAEGSLINFICSGAAIGSTSYPEINLSVEFVPD